MKKTPVEYRTIGLHNAPCEDCGSPNTIIYKHSHINEGMWQCVDCEAMDQCSHISIHHEEVENDTVDSRGEHTTYETTVTVCDHCEVTLDD